MRLVGLTRLALGLQVVLGIVLFAGWFRAVVVPVHVALALTIVVLALVALRPGRAGLPGGPLQTSAWLAPLLPLALGLSFRFDLLGGTALVVVHMALGLLAFGLVVVAQSRAGANPTTGAKVPG